ncbi:hypothetical protein, partial [Rhizobium sp. 21-4511-3d]
CVNPVIVICRSLVRQQHQQSRADPEGGVKTPLTHQSSSSSLSDTNTSLNTDFGGVEIMSQGVV